MMKSKKKPSKEKSEDMDDAKFNHSIALGNEGRDMYGRGEHRQAVAKLEECLAICGKIKELEKQKRVAGPAQSMLDAARKNLAAQVLDEGNKLNRAGSPMEALAKYQECLTIGGVITNEDMRKKVLGPAYGSLGNVQKKMGDFESAIKSHEAALAISRDMGNRWLEGNELVNLGNVYTSLGQYEKAAASHEAAHALHREIGKAGRIDDEPPPSRAREAPRRRAARPRPRPAAPRARPPPPPRRARARRATARARATASSAGSSTTSASRTRPAR